VVYVDLSRGLDELRADTRVNHTRNIRALEQAGFTTVLDDWEMYPAFGPFYRAAMQRLNAAPFYFFSDEYFDELRDQLRGRLHLLTVLTPDRQLAAAGLFTETCRVVEYHLGGTAAAYLRHAPSKLMFDAAIRWAKAGDAEVLGLGGGMGGAGGSLFEFKAGFSRSRGAFHTVRMILHDAMYVTLVGRWRSLGGDQRPAGDFFPLYRAAL
jgi:hypothetical protein